MRFSPIGRLTHVAALVLACAKPQSVTAVTIPQSVTVAPHPPFVDPAVALVDAARGLIDEKQFDAASESLFAIVCHGHELHRPADFAKCPPPATDGVAAGWSFVGQLALNRQLVVSGSGWMTARHVVGRWSHGSMYPTSKADAAGDDLLAIAEIAYVHATTSSTPDTPLWLFTLATVRWQRARYEAALRTYLQVLDGQATDPKRNYHKDEALEQASACIALADWDGDGTDDDLRRFARPDVQRALEHEAPYMPKLYARAVGRIAADRACDDANIGLAAMTHRFPKSDLTAQARSEVLADCP